jgi:TolA-binding protein
MCHDRLGASQRAREYWDRLKNEYPRSDAAKRIPAAGREASPKGPKENR